MGLYSGTGQDDVLYGSASADLIKGRNGDDDLYGLDGNDELRGGRGEDILYGGIGNDKLKGGRDSDTLYGGEGNDRLFGGNGDDFIHSDGGVDIAKGGAGADVFIFSPNTEVVTIKDFENGVDLMDVSAFGFDQNGQSANYAGYLEVHGDDTHVVFYDINGETARIILEDFSHTDIDMTDYIL